MLGKIQSIIVGIGKQRGFVNQDDVYSFYKSGKEVKTTMNKLVVFGYFKTGVQDKNGMRWKYIGKD